MKTYEENRREQKRHARIVIFITLIISILLTSVVFIGEYNNYEAQRQPILTACNWVNNAQATYNINTSVYDLEQAQNALTGTHGNPVWILTTSATQWSAIKTQLIGTMQEGKYLAGHQGNLSGLSYQLAYQQYDASLHTLHNTIGHNYQWIAFSPLLTLLTVFAIVFYIIEMLVFFLYSDEAFGVFGDGVEFGAFSIGNTLYVFAWFPVFFIFMAIYA